MNAGLIGPGEGQKRYTARGSVMFFKALAEQDDGDLSLMERTLPQAAAGRRRTAGRAALAQRRLKLKGRADPSAGWRN